MKQLLPKPMSVDWPVEQIAERGRKDRFFYLLLGSARVHQHALNDWTPNVDSELSAISDLFHEGGVRIAVQQSRSIEDQLRSAFGSGHKLNELCEQVSRIETKLDHVLKKLEEASSRPQSVMIPIETLAPEPYDLLRPVAAVITTSGEEFEAGLYDASIFASGDTEEDALANLKDTLIDTYERLNELSDDKLGPGPLRQKHVLDKLIRKVENR